MVMLPARLKNKIRNSLRQRLFGGRKFIDEVISIEHTYDLIKRSQIGIHNAVDIGANAGQWAENFFSHFPSSSLLSIEANPVNLAPLKRVNPDSMQACLAEIAGEIRTFYLPNPAVEKNNTGASLYKEVLPGYQDPVCLELKTSTLDGLKRQFDLIKLDV